jgi:hypothetical protein
MMVIWLFIIALLSWMLGVPFWAVLIIATVMLLVYASAY